VLLGGPGFEPHRPCIGVGLCDCFDEFPNKLRGIVHLFMRVGACIGDGRIMEVFPQGPPK